jgi:hypothetical protein
VSFGFNTDVQVDSQTFHVQTEGRGPASAPALSPASSLIDTAVYLNGMVVYRRSTSDESIAKSPEFTPEALKHRVEEQHRAVIQELRSNTLDAEIAKSVEDAKRAPGIQVRLLNPKSWLSSGKVTLDVEIFRRADRRPEEGARAMALIEGAGPSSIHSAISDVQGKAHIEFPLPARTEAQADLTLVIQAQTDYGQDEIRFAVRARRKEPAADRV